MWIEYTFDTGIFDVNYSTWMKNLRYPKGQFQSIDAQFVESEQFGF